jgi:hypothetical protein
MKYWNFLSKYLSTEFNFVFSASQIFWQNLKAVESNEALFTHNAVSVVDVYKT